MDFLLGSERHEDGEGWGCAVSAKLVASASGKSAVVIGYLTIFFNTRDHQTKSRMK